MKFSGSLRVTAQTPRPTTVTISSFTLEPPAKMSRAVCAASRPLNVARPFKGGTAARYGLCVARATPEQATRVRRRARDAALLLDLDPAFQGPATFNGRSRGGIRRFCRRTLLLRRICLLCPPYVIYDLVKIINYTNGAKACSIRRHSGERSAGRWCQVGRRVPPVSGCVECLSCVQPLPSSRSSGAGRLRPSPSRGACPEPSPRVSA